MVDSSLFEYGQQSNAQADTLVHFFTGAMDPGGAGRLAVEQLKEATIVGRVATFNPDELLDYRSTRPLATISSWQIEQMESSQICLDLATDLDGHHFLLLHGPEPDFRWEAFCEVISSLATRAGVKKTISLLSVPAGVPHTRPLQVHRLEGSPVRNQSFLEDDKSIIKISCSLDIFLIERLARAGFKSSGLVASVPYYLFESDYFPAATELLRTLAAETGLSIPVGDLEAAGSIMVPQIEAMILENPESKGLIQGLEQSYDSRNQESVGGGATSEDDLSGFIIPSQEEIGRQLESFLRMEEDRHRRAHTPKNELGPWSRLSRRSKRKGWPFGTSEK
ncbi:PAC2 family protein [Actinomycetaceae bacterium TAE3-ERU4]|nr:PAC2 family protein [Actinomycetaceae bacterium TAE3-ERU4]